MERNAQSTAVLARYISGGGAEAGQPKISATIGRLEKHENGMFASPFPPSCA